MEKINLSLASRRARSGMVSIYVKAMQYHKTVCLETNIKVFADEWDEKNGIVISNRHANRINLMLRKIIYEIEEYEFSYANGISLSRLNTLWKHRDIIENFYEIVNNNIATRNITPLTLQNHKMCFQLLSEYSPKCRIVDLDEDFVRGFYMFLKRKEWQPGKHYKDGTINKYMEMFRSYYFLARQLYKIKVPESSFKWYKYAPPARKIKSINEDDVRLLENHAAMTNNIVLHQFLFMCYTGLRISDFASLCTDNIKDINGKMWLYYTSVKTRVEVKIPLSNLFGGKPEQIIYKYFNDIKTFFSIGDKSCWNRKLQKQSIKANLNKHISSHIGRHTFACRLLSKNIPITTIQVTIGHKKLESTMRYAKITQDTLSRQLSFM